MFNYKKVQDLKEKLRVRDDLVKDLHEKLDKHEEKKSLEIGKLKHTHELEVAKIHSEYFIKLTELSLLMSKDHDDEMLSLRKQVQNAEAQSQAKELVIKAKEETMKQLQEQLKFVFTKIPSFDLNKLNFSVHTEQNNK